MFGSIRRLCIAPAFLLMVAAGSASAAVVELTGQTVKFVFDTGDLTFHEYLDRFGSARVLPGTDTLRFIPDGWTAQAMYPVPVVDSSNDTITFDVVALDDLTRITAASLEGGGDYYKVGGYVGVGGELRVNSTDIDSIIASDFSDTLTPVNPIITTPWTESAALDGYFDESITVTVEEILTARVVTLEGGEVVFNGLDAFVEKKFVDISIGSSTIVDPVVVPIPAAFGMMWSALVVVGATGLRARRRSADSPTPKA